MISAVVVGWTSSVIPGVGTGERQSGDRHRLARADVRRVEGPHGIAGIQRHVVPGDHAHQGGIGGIESGVGGAVVALLLAVMPVTVSVAAVMSAVVVGGVRM